MGATPQRMVHRCVVESSMAGWPGRLKPMSRYGSLVEVKPEIVPVNAQTWNAVEGLVAAQGAPDGFCNQPQLPGHCWRVTASYPALIAVNSHDVALSARSTGPASGVAERASGPACSTWRYPAHSRGGAMTIKICGKPAILEDCTGPRQESAPCGVLLPRAAPSRNAGRQ